MTVKPESNFWRLLKKHIPAYWDRIENRHGGGTPDLIGIREGVTIFIELKCIKQNSINISPLQISRNINIFQHGGKNYYLVQDTRSKVLKLYGGDKGRELKEQGFKCPCNMELDPKKYNNERIYNKLECYLFS
mgnify:CR=1 FL=1